MNVVKGGYDPRIHIGLKEAAGLNGLSENDIRNRFSDFGYSIKNGEKLEYVDRLELGRAMHKPMHDKSGIKFERYFTKDCENPYNPVGPFESRTIKIVDDEKGIVFNMGATFPKSWSNNSASVAAQKYFFKPHREDWKEKIPGGMETDPRMLFDRVATFFGIEGRKFGYFKTDEEQMAFEDELKFLQINQMFAFNSPVYFNAGLYHKLGITGTAGMNFYRNPDTGEVTEVTEGCYVHPQTHACFIKGPEDNLESILQHVLVEGAIFSNGSGIGQDIGVLREEDAPLSGGGKASGPLSFLKVYDCAAGSIKSGGKSRRAARMTTMGCTHPDIMNFIRAKVNEDHKAKILMGAGYSGGMDGEACTTVAFQNTNLSVRCDDHFFELVKNDGEVELYSIKTGKVVGKVSARRMLQEISFGSWRDGDPAIQNKSKIDEFHTCPNSGEIRSSNPCSEYMFLDNTSCNLGSLNLLKFADERGEIDIEKLRKASRTAEIALIIANHSASYPNPEVAEISPEFATTGLGFANLGSLLMVRGMAYDSNEGRAYAAALMAIIHGEACRTSAEVAEGMGTFVHYELNKKPMLDVMRKHQSALKGIEWELLPLGLEEQTKQLYEELIELGEKNGFATAQMTVLAPTGTIGRMMGCSTTGIEPVYATISKKSLAGGGNLFEEVEEIPLALKNLGYSDLQINGILNFIEKNAGVEGAPHLRLEHYPIFDSAVSAKPNGRAISLEGHIRMLAACTSFVSGAISKTNNCPNSAKVKDIYDGYILAYQLGVKAVSIFRDRSKPSYAMEVGGSIKQKKALARGEKEPLPQTGLKYYTKVDIGGTTFDVAVTEYEDGKVGEIWVACHKPGSTLGALLNAFGVNTSVALKHGAPLEEIIEKNAGVEFEPRGFTNHPHIRNVKSIIDFVARWIKLEYFGDLDASEVPENVDVSGLRGSVTGATMRYKRSRLDDWNFETVIKDPIWGGFVENGSGDGGGDKAQQTILFENGKNDRILSSGCLCITCGKIMTQNGSNCFVCECGNTAGLGCGG